MSSKFRAERIRPSHVCRRPIPGRPQPPPGPPESLDLIVTWNFNPATPPSRKTRKIRLIKTGFPNIWQGTSEPPPTFTVLALLHWFPPGRGYDLFVTLYDGPVQPIHVTWDDLLVNTVSPWYNPMTPSNIPVPSEFMHASMSA